LRKSISGPGLLSSAVGQGLCPQRASPWRQLRVREGTMRCRRRHRRRISTREVCDVHIFVRWPFRSTQNTCVSFRLYSFCPPSENSARRESGSLILIIPHAAAAAAVFGFVSRSPGWETRIHSRIESQTIELGAAIKKSTHSCTYLVADCSTTERIPPAPCSCWLGQKKSTCAMFFAHKRAQLCWKIAHSIAYRAIIWICKVIKRAGMQIPDRINSWAINAPNSLLAACLCV
jgi:hypothetical protein